MPRLHSNFYESLLTYEIHDIYLEYKENMISGDPYQDRQNVNLISEYYESGDLENFLQQHPVNIRIDDCSNQDLTKLAEINTNAASFFEKYAASYQTNTILISYRSKEDYLICCLYLYLGHCYKCRRNHVGGQDRRYSHKSLALEYVCLSISQFNQA